MQLAWKQVELYLFIFLNARAHSIMDNQLYLTSNINKTLNLARQLNVQQNKYGCCIKHVSIPVVENMTALYTSMGLGISAGCRYLQEWPLIYPAMCKCLLMCKQKKERKRESEWPSSAFVWILSSHMIAEALFAVTLGGTSSNFSHHFLLA